MYISTPELPDNISEYNLINESGPLGPLGHSRANRMLEK